MEAVTTSNIELEEKNDNNEVPVKKEKKRTVRFEMFLLYNKY